MCYMAESNSSSCELSWGGGGLIGRQQIVNSSLALSFSPFPPVKLNNGLCEEQDEGLNYGGSSSSSSSSNERQSLLRILQIGKEIKCKKVDLYMVPDIAFHFNA